MNHQISSIKKAARRILSSYFFRCVLASFVTGTGIQRPNISRLESGKYNPTLDMIVRVADSIGLEVEITLKEKNN